MSSVLLPLRAARNAGIPINRTVLLPIVEQIIARSRAGIYASSPAPDSGGRAPSRNAVASTAWLDALLLVREERELLARNTDLCVKLINSVQTHTSQWEACFLLLRETAQCCGRCFDARLFLPPSTAAENTATPQNPQKADGELLQPQTAHRFWGLLADNQRWQELRVLREAAESLADAPATKLLLPLEFKALVQRGRWAGAAQLLAERSTASASSSGQHAPRHHQSHHHRQHSMSLPPAALAFALPYGSTSMFQHQLLERGRWVEGTRLFQEAMSQIVDRERAWCSAGAGAAMAGATASAQQQQSDMQVASVVNASLATIAAAPSWELPLRALSLVHRFAPAVRLTSTALELAARAGVDASSITGSSTVPCRFGSLPAIATSAAQHARPSAVRRPPQHFDTKRNAENTVALILDLVRGGRWLDALGTFERLTLSSAAGTSEHRPAAPRPTHFLAARAAGAIMVHMSKIADWRAAFAVFHRVVAARAMVTGTAQMEESDQRALLFVCAGHRRWVEAFRLLQTRTRTEDAPLAALQQNRGGGAHSSSSDRSERVGLAFHSRPPWHVALQLARAVWPLTAGNDVTRTAILSNVAAAALLEGSTANADRERQQQDAPTAVGVGIVARMLAQGLVPRGDVLTLLPEDTAVEMVRSGRFAISLVDMTLAIRGGSSLAHMMQQRGEKHHGKQYREPQHQQRPPSWEHALNLTRAALECPQNSIVHQQQPRQDSFDVVFRRAKFCKAASEVLFYYGRERWIEALRICQLLSETLSAVAPAATADSNAAAASDTKSASTSSAAVVIERDSAPEYLPRTQSDAWQMTLNDARATFAAMLQLLAFHAPTSSSSSSAVAVPVASPAAAAIAALLSAMDRARLPLRYFSRRMSPFVAASATAEPQQQHHALKQPQQRQTGQAESDVHRQASGMYAASPSALARPENAAVAVRVLRKVLGSYAEDEENSSFPVAARDAFFFCAHHHRGSAEIAAQGLAAFDLLVRADDGLRRADAVFLPELCRIAGPQRGGGWLHALQCLAAVERREGLHHQAVENFMTHFESQWRVSAQLFQHTHRDAVFRALLKSGKLSSS